MRGLVMDLEARESPRFAFLGPVQEGKKIIDYIMKDR